MIRSAVTGLIFVFFVSTMSFCQTEEHIWKPLVVSDGQKIWYDETAFRNSKDDVLDVWVLQMHRPPLMFENIRGDVYRSKTLYSVDLTSAKYGIKLVVYYNVENREIFRHNYSVETNSKDILFNYPITEGSSLNEVIKVFLNNKDNR